MSGENGMDVEVPKHLWTHVRFAPLSPSKDETIILPKETSTHPMSAARKPFTSKPGTSHAVRAMTAASMTSVNSPRVRMLSGRLIASKIGRMRAFTNPKMSAAHNAVHSEATSNPGTTRLTSRKTEAFSNKRIMRFIRSPFEISGASEDVRDVCETPACQSDELRPESP